MRAPKDDVLQLALSGSRWSSQQLADAVGVDIRTVQRARTGHVSRNVARELYRLLAAPPPEPPAPWACPECRGRDFARVCWTDGSLTHWYACSCGAFWLRYDDPDDSVPTIAIDWHVERPTWTTGRSVDAASASR